MCTSVTEFGDETKFLRFLLLQITLVILFFLLVFSSAKVSQWIRSVSYYRFTLTVDSEERVHVCALVFLILSHSKSLFFTLSTPLLQSELFTLKIAQVDVYCAAAIGNAINKDNDKYHWLGKSIRPAIGCVAHPFEGHWRAGYCTRGELQLAKNTLISKVCHVLR